MSTRDEFLESIADTIKDYRLGEIEIPDAAHVDRWVKQFQADVQVPILEEMNYVLDKTYFSLNYVVEFLEKVVICENITGIDTHSFWNSAKLLNIQLGGNSQNAMLELFEQVLQKTYGFGINEGEGTNSTYVYIDDVVFTGNRVRRDIETWIRDCAPQNAILYIVVIAFHSGGRHYAQTKLDELAVCKNIKIQWFRSLELEDRKIHSHLTDLLWPTKIPTDKAVQEYAALMRYPPTFRKPGNVGQNSLFSSEDRKNLLEQEFLKSGVGIRQRCSNLSDTQRPLGHSTLVTLGFGSLVVTFRNCPNNAPLALWVGHPWYPLFPRTTNKQTETKRLIYEFLKPDNNDIPF
ncbi:MAG: hypothetical protein NTZ72_18080 [Afipia sp.]|nr:hypothetical protein [Afipia sp.]